MTKIIIGFVLLAAVAIFVMLKGGHVKMGGEHAAQEAMTQTDSAAAKKE